MPEELNVVAELRDGMCIARVGVNDMMEQDVNARMMDEAKFNRLVENIRKRGALEQLPYCALTDRGVEIVSGHHRVRAARMAGLKEVEVLLDRSKLTRSAIAAKQLAHNAIEGVDDEDMVRKIASIITDVDDMLESAIDPSFFEKVEREAAAIPQVKVSFDWKTVQFTFLPGQIEDLKELCDRTQGADFEGVAAIEQFEPFVEALQRTEKFADIRSVGTAVHFMTKRALSDFGELEGEGRTCAQVFGRAIMPEKTAEKMKALIREAMEDGLIENPWEVLELLAEGRSDG